MGFRINKNRIGAAVGKSYRIVKGITNSVSRKDYVEFIQGERMGICKVCDKRKAGDVCGVCGCHLPWKTRVLEESCPEGKWGSVSVSEAVDRMTGEL